MTTPVNSNPPPSPVVTPHRNHSGLSYAAAHVASAAILGLGAASSLYGINGLIGVSGITASTAALGYAAAKIQRHRRSNNTTKRLNPGGRTGALNRLRGRKTLGGTGLATRKKSAQHALAGARRKGLVGKTARTGLLGKNFTKRGLLGKKPAIGKNSGLISNKRPKMCNSTNGAARGFTRARKNRNNGLSGTTKRQGIARGLNGNRSRTHPKKSGPKTNSKNALRKRIKKLIKRRKNEPHVLSGTVLDAPEKRDEKNEPTKKEPPIKKKLTVPNSRRRTTAPQGGKMGHISDATETVAAAIGRADISSARKLDAIFEEIATSERRLADSKRQLASRVGEEFPADPAVVEHLEHSASIQARISEQFKELRGQFRRLHAGEWERLDNPRRGEEAWDHLRNQE